MKRYGERYNLLKTPRQLRWQPHQGQVSVKCNVRTRELDEITDHAHHSLSQVEMEVEVDGVHLSLEVSPLLATILLQV